MREMNVTDGANLSLFYQGAADTIDSEKMVEETTKNYYLSQAFL